LNNKINPVKIISLIRKQYKQFKVPSVTEISNSGNPYLVLISCILSLRTKDKTTIEASKRLFKVADNPKVMLGMSIERLMRIIYPVGFYRNKAKQIQVINKKLLEEYDGKVPDTIDELLKFKGVGRKTANLVLGLGYRIPAICVDTHVHRISNRLGWVKTSDPQDTEELLKQIISERLWIELNTLLVAFGQNVCLPVSPYCSKCKVFKYCPRNGVIKYR